MVLRRGSGGRDTGSIGSVIAGSCCLFLALSSAHRAFAAATVHAASAGPGLANLVIPPDAPSMQSFEAATLASVDAYYAPFYGLSSLLDGSGNPVSISTDNGTTAYAYLDGVGNVIIAYRWDITQQQENLATATLSGYDPGTLPGYADALAFERTVQALAVSQGYAASRIYVTGFSLGGMQASYVASQTGLPGLSFGSSGLPGYDAATQPADNFVNFVEQGDPIAEYGTDSTEAASAVVANPHMDHYGVVIDLGTQQGVSDLAPFSAAISGYSYPEVSSGAVAVPAAELTALQNEFSALEAEYHQMSPYIDDANAFVESYGINPTVP